MAYSQEIETHITLTHQGDKEVRVVTITLKDGVEVGSANHRYTIAYYEDIPQEIIDIIDDKKIKKPKKPDND